MKKNLISMLLMSAASLLPVSSYADDGGNKWTAKSITEKTGTSEVPLLVYLNNPMTITGVQFDIYLPEGVSVKSTGRTKTYSIGMGSARYEELDHSLSSSLQDDGAVRVLCVSTTNAPIWDDDVDGKDIRGTEPLVQITLSLAEGLAAGTYDIAFKNISVTHYETKTELYNLEDVFTQLIIKPESGVSENTVNHVAVFSSAEGAKCTKDQYQSYIQSQENLAAVDLRAAELDEGFTVEDLRKDLGNNALVFLPTGSTISGNNIVVDGECSKLSLNDESSLNVIVPFTAQSAQYERGISGIGTICLPFAPSTDNFDYYELNDADVSTLNFVRVDAPKANTPYLFRKNGTGNSISASNVKIHVGEVQSTAKGQWVMQGTFSKQSFTSVDDVYALSANKLYHNTGNLNINPFRAYFKYSSSGVKEMTITLDGEVTLIESLDSNISKGENIYNLNGQKVGNNYNGIVIVNGRKELRK